MRKSVLVLVLMAFTSLLNQLPETVFTTKVGGTAEDPGQGNG
jgi:hypothetical protein